MAQLELYLFGPPRLVRTGRALNLGLRKALALLVYLAVTKQPHSRDALATLLWPEDGQGVARSNLRRILYRIHETLEDEVLATAGDMVALNPELDLWVDTEIFQQQRQACPPAGEAPALLDPTSLEQLEAAAALYTDDFLAGFTLPDSPTFDDWQFFQRDQLRHLLAGILEQLATSYQLDGKFDLAIERARRWLALDPFNETAHRELMRLYAHSNQLGAALRQYQECTRLLDEEFGAAPEEATTALFEAIRTRRFIRGFAQAETTTVHAQEEDHSKEHRDHLLTAPHVVAPRLASRHNLPPQSTPFIGREQEVAALCDRLQDGACRLLTLVGPGGSGKTRLAIHVAQRLLEQAGDLFPDGLYFVPLAPLQQPTEVAAAIVNALGLAIAGDKLPGEELLRYLRNKRLLLILDNFEHLLPATTQVEALLEAGPGVKLLVTAREALNLAEEWFHAIGGLSFPAEGEEGREPLDRYDALRLFEQCAHRARADFSLALAQDAVLLICRLVDGLPLALELAAAWLHTLSAEAVADELAQGFEILTARRRNLPERHRSMRAVLAQSWVMLNQQEQQVLARLSVFRGGFTFQAAEAVAGASLLMMATLVEKALLRTTAAGRYQIHELLRQFAAEQLAARPVDESAARTDHCRHYLTFLAENDTSLYGKQQQQALATVGQEIDNVRIAWDWALNNGELDLIEQAVEPLYRFFWTRCRNREGEAFFTNALTQLQQTATLQGHPRYEYALLRLRAQRALFYQFQGDYDACEREHLQSLALARKLDQQRSIGYLVSSLGVLAGWRGRYAQAQTLIVEGRTIFERLNHRYGVAHVLQELATLALETGEFTTGKQLAAESLLISQELERPDWTAWAHDALGHGCFVLGEYEVASHHYQSAVSIFEQIGHERGFALGLGGLGLVAWAQGEEGLAQAQRLIERSLALFRKIGYRLHIASRLGLLALILNAQQEYAAAQSLAQEGLVIAAELDTPGVILQNLFVLAEAAYQQGHFSTSQRHLHEALALAATCGLWPALLTGFYHVACLLLQEQAQGKEISPAPVAASALLALVAEHPAAWHVFRSRAQRSLAQMETTAVTDFAQEPAALRTLAEQLCARL
jgi:predicted ATPase/DNA-binding SARP family transcriptional activator